MFVVTIDGNSNYFYESKEAWKAIVDAHENGCRRVTMRKMPSVTIGKAFFEAFASVNEAATAHI